MAVTGKESIQKVKRSTEYTRYSYTHTDDSFFQCVKPSLEECRRQRNRWIEKCYLLETGQIVFGQSKEHFFVLNPNIKGYVVLIAIATAGIQLIRRSLFFTRFTLFGANNNAEILDDTGMYELMLRAYHLQFGKNKQTNNKL